MDILKVTIEGALLLVAGLMGTGIWSMARGGKFDQRHSTQLMFARTGLQGVTVLLLLAIYLTN